MFIHYLSYAVGQLLDCTTYRDVKIFLDKGLLVWL